MGKAGMYLFLLNKILLRRGEVINLHVVEGELTKAGGSDYEEGSR